MSSNPLISIITINYNNKDGLRKTIDSVKSQVFSSYEHIIIDGGSSDGSVDVIQDALKNKKYASHVAYWCSERDGGIYPAMNKGIEHVSGNFVYMLNSGDALLPDALSKISPFLLDNLQKVVCAPVDCYFNGAFVKTSGMAAEHLSVGMIPHQGVFVPRFFHEKYGGYNEAYKICADRELMLRLRLNGVPFEHMPIIVCAYDEGGVSSTARLRMITETYKLDRSMGKKRGALYRYGKELLRYFLKFGR